MELLSTQKLLYAPFSSFFLSVRILFCILFSDTLNLCGRQGTVLQILSAFRHWDHVTYLRTWDANMLWGGRKAFLNITTLYPHPYLKSHAAFRNEGIDSMKWELPLTAPSLTYGMIRSSNTASLMSMMDGKDCQINITGFTTKWHIYRKHDISTGFCAGHHFERGTLEDRRDGDRRQY